MTSGKVKQGKETWWWSNEVQRCIQEKKGAKKALLKTTPQKTDKQRKRVAKRAVATVSLKHRPMNDSVYEELDTKEEIKESVENCNEKEQGGGGHLPSSL